MISDPEAGESDLSVFSRAKDVTGDASSALRDRVSANLDVDLPFARAKIDDPTRPLGSEPALFRSCCRHRGSFLRGVPGLPDRNVTNATGDFTNRSERSRPLSHFATGW